MLRIWIQIFSLFSSKTAFLASILNCLFAAVSNVLIFQVYFEITECFLSAFSSMVFVCFSSLFWHQTTVLEVFTLNNLFVASILYCYIEFQKAENGNKLNLYLISLNYTLLRMRSHYSFERVILTLWLRNLSKVW